MSGYLSVRNWDEFQHYKDRNPPWIKLHRSLLNNYEFQCLQDASKAHLVGIWLLASQLDNKIPADAAWIGQRIAATTPIDLTALIDKGFLLCSEPASALLAKRSPETEAEAEAEAEKKTEARKRATFVKPSVSEVAEYIRNRGSPVDAEAFVAFYESKGWKVGKQSMKDWKSAIVTWEKRNETSNGNARGPVRIESTLANLRHIAGEEEGGESLAAPRGDVRGEVYDGVFERTE